MTRIKPIVKKIRTLPCGDCEVEVPVGDDAVGVVCTACTQKRLNVYEKALNAPEETNGDDNLTVEGTHDRVKAKKPKVKVIRKRKMKKSRVK